MTSRTYHDPLHRNIQLDGGDAAEAMVMGLVDNRPFQRLRRIRQLGPAFLTFMARNQVASPTRWGCFIWHVSLSAGWSNSIQV